MDEKQERRLRRKAIRLWLQGYSDRQIQQHIPRSLGWLHKWQQRYTDWGWNGLRSQSHRPHQPTGYPALVRQIVLRVRRHLSRRQVGRLIGARAIHWEIRRAQLLPKNQCPSRPTHPAHFTVGTSNALCQVSAGRLPSPSAFHR